MRVIPVSFVCSGHLFSPQLWFTNKRIYSKAIAITHSDFKKKKRKERSYTLSNSIFTRPFTQFFRDIMYRKLKNIGLPVKLQCNRKFYSGF